MGKIRAVKNNPYSMISNNVLWDKSISVKAKFILIFCLSLADNWEYNVQGLAKCIGMSCDAISKGLQELEKVGYLKRKQLKTEAGKFAGYDYVFVENPENRKGDFSCTEMSYTDFSYTKKQGQLNNNIYNNNLINNQINESSEEEKPQAVKNADNDEQKEKLAEVLDMFQNNIHPFKGPLECEQLIEAFKDFGYENVKEAIRRAVKHDGRNVAYVEKTASSLADGLDFEKKAKEKISEQQKKRFEDILHGRIAVKDCSSIECKAITQCGGTWEMKNRLEKDDEKWLKNLCDAYMGLLNGARKQNS